jgi:NADPH:quinone reductase-like Zn-dependent oxidoreductase
MKAAYIEEFGGPDKIKTGNLDKPEPGDGEVLIKVDAAGVNPVDTAVVKGMLNEVIPADFPAVPGWDVAGIIEQRGYSARRFEEGDKVYAYARRPEIKHGTFAEYIAIPESYVAKRPETATAEESGGIPLVGLTAYQALFDAGNLKEGETVLILGASGGVGSMAIQLAKWKGANVIGVAGSSNQEYMQKLGADETIDYSGGDLSEAVNKAAPSGVDMIFHCSRGDSLKQCSGSLKENGRLISITNSNPDRREDVYFEYVFVEPNAVQLEHLAQLADDGHLSVHVSKTYNLDETAEALAKIETLHTRGKIIITP